MLFYALWILNSQIDHLEVPAQPAARFQRSEKWMPVYKWLESLDLDSLVGAKAIEAWLDGNPCLREELLKEHTRQHLFRYVQKCHNNLLKKKKKQALKVAMVRYVTVFRFIFNIFML